ncbi:MAG TPA: response regulator, partial [Flavobacteriales bacterium]|nr:response regulator [Flavobacteriales bacterium]
MEHPTVLIVEDDARVLQFIKQGLEENGFKVVVAQDGESGWKLARAQAYDAVVLDVMLPRMRGSELCRRIREHDAGARILM